MSCGQGGLLLRYRECEDVVSNAPLRQGDVIRPLTFSEDPWSGSAVIVTADCDLARNKHNGRLTCVPVLPIEKYLSMFYMPDRIGRLLATAENKLGSMVRQYQLMLEGFDEPIDDKSAAEWVVETPPEDVTHVLGIHGKDGVLFAAIAKAYCAARANKLTDFKAQVMTSCDLQVALGHHRERDVARTARMKDVIQSVERLPGDAMFLNALSDELHNGYVCYLRVLREISDDEVATRASMRSFRIKYERISRLRAPFVYALSQQLGSVFSAIGLPEEYEGARRHCAADIENNFSDTE
jgi:hypothetical protein